MCSGHVCYGLQCLNISYAISILSFFLPKLGKYIRLQYNESSGIFKAQENKVWYFDQRVTNPGQVVGYFDFSFARDLDEKHFITGFVF